MAAFTTDGDIVIDPSSLPSTPPLEATLQEAGFTRTSQPGSWTLAVTIDGRKIDVSIDFMVPEAVAPGGGRRSVDLEGHDRQSTRRVPGLEAALVDRGPMRIAAIDPADSRTIVAQVAGPAALMIAKLHKIGERVESGRHRRTPVDKDASDVYRLVQVTPHAEMAAGFRLALSTDVARPAAEVAIRRLQELFGRRQGAGVEMTIRATGVSGEAPATISAVLTAYTAALTAELCPWAGGDGTGQHRPEYEAAIVRSRGASSPYRTGADLVEEGTNRCCRPRRRAHRRCPVPGRVSSPAGPVDAGHPGRFDGRSRAGHLSCQAQLSASHVAPVTSAPRTGSRNAAAAR